MKSVIYCVIDAFCYDNLLIKNGDEFVTPFLHRMAENNISFSEIYTIAPYTEASQVTVIGDELCLENGGYLFGNGCVDGGFIKYFKEKGYKTIYEYSPYVYSKGYLRGVDDFFYSRPYSLSPLFTYRFQYYRDKGGSLTEMEIKVCLRLLNEGLDTWIEQCERVIKHDESCQFIMSYLPGENDVKRICKELKSEKIELAEQELKYIEDLLFKWKEHRLWKMNQEYTGNRVFSLNDYIQNTYGKKLVKYQKKISRIYRKQLPDLRYIFSQRCNNINGKSDAIGLFKNYVKIYLGKPLTDYIDGINSNVKPDISMHNTFSAAFRKIKKYDDQSVPYFLYMQPQDFHLPSVFHTFDVDDKDLVDSEFKKCFDFLETLKNTKINVISLLSAFFCDYKIEEFYNKCKRELKNDFIFVVTADHGYPSYNNPPRPYTYNQTYTEAFHVPYIIIDSDCMRIENTKDIISNKEANTVLKSILNGENIEISSPGYVLSEYAGPGCPVITEKPVWYTYIDKRYRLSVQAMLGEKINRSHVTDIYDLKKDKNEQFNLRKKKEINVGYILDIINKRHGYLSGKFNSENFYRQLLESLD